VFCVVKCEWQKLQQLVSLQLDHYSNKKTYEMKKDFQKHYSRLLPLVSWVIRIYVCGLRQQSYGCKIFIFVCICIGKLTVRNIG